MTITVDEFYQLTGKLAPSDFEPCAAIAKENVDAYTLYGYAGRDEESLPADIVRRYKLALALQTMYISQQGGVSAIAEAAPNSVSLGSFSYSGGNTEQSQQSSNAIVSPAVRAIMPILVAYARGLQR